MDVTQVDATPSYPPLPVPTHTVGPLTAKEYKERLVTSEGKQSVQLPRPPPPSS